MRTILKSTPRAAMTGGALNQMRRNGDIPATISTRGAATQHCTVSREKLSSILRQYGDSALIEMEGTSESGSVLVISRDIQRDAISGKLTHVGFQRLTTRGPITAEVRVTLVGKPHDAAIGVGALEQVASFVQVKALPDKLPQAVAVDTSGMTIGSVLHVSALPAYVDFEIVTPGDTVIAVLQTVRAAISQSADDSPAETAEAVDAKG